MITVEIVIFRMEALPRRKLFKPNRITRTGGGIYHSLEYRSLAVEEIGDRGLRFGYFLKESNWLEWNMRYRNLDNLLLRSAACNYLDYTGKLGLEKILWFNGEHQVSFLESE